MLFGNLTYEVEDNIALIGLNRPTKRNAINDDMINELKDAIELAAAQAKVGVIFGHGAHFCAGLDLAEHAERTPFEGVLHSRKWHKIFNEIERGPIPFVVALHGAVVGGGLELAASAQIRVAEEEAFFGLPEGQRGIFVGGGGSVRIARLMTASRMADLMLEFLDLNRQRRLRQVQMLRRPRQASGMRDRPEITQVIVVQVSHIVLLIRTIFAEQ